MKLSDVLDTRPFNALTIALGLLIAVSFILAPSLPKGTWHDRAVSFREIDLSLLFTGGYYPEDLLNHVDYFAWQSITVQW
jgi:hypothetical protein